MKIRNGFVSNSSSSSFVIDKRYLSPYQIEQIWEHLPDLDTPCEKPGTCKMDSWGWPSMDTCQPCTSRNYRTSDRWEMKESDDYIRGYTSQDNFSMRYHLEKIGVPDRQIQWGDYWEYENDYYESGLHEDS